MNFLSVNIFNHHFGEELTVAVFTAIAFATLLFEDDYFFTFYEVLEYLASHVCTFYGRRTDFNVAVGIDEKHFVEYDLVTLLGFFAEVVDVQIFAFFGLELLSFDFYDCVHRGFKLNLKVGP